MVEEFKEHLSFSETRDVAMQPHLVHTASKGNEKEHEDNLLSSCHCILLLGVD